MRRTEKSAYFLRNPHRILKEGWKENERNAGLTQRDQFEEKREPLCEISLEFRLFLFFFLKLLLSLGFQGRCRGRYGPILRMGLSGCEGSRANLLGFENRGFRIA